MTALERTLTRVLKSRLYPDGLRWLTLCILLPIIGVLLFGPADPHSPVHLLVWLAWWPMLCVLFLAAGRIWCAMCPFSMVGDWVRRTSGLGYAVPEFLKQQEGWLILITFFLLSWLEEVTDAVHSPRATAIVLLLILSGAVVFSLFFRGHTWCRYLCPLGGLSLVYGRTGLLKIRSNAAACAECVTKDCVVPDAQFPGCPMQLTPFAVDSGVHCKVCGLCVKRCTNDSLHLAFEAPSKDLAGQTAVAPPAVWMVVFLTGFISYLNAMKSGLCPLEAWVHRSGQPMLAKTALMAVAMAASYGLFQLLARRASDPSGKVPRPRLLVAGALPMIPLLLLTHLGYLSSKLWADGGTLLDSLAASLGTARPAGWESFLAAPWTGYVSPALIGLGLAAALGVLRWALSQTPALSVRRPGLAFGSFYLVFAGWNLLAVWPFPASAAALPDATRAAAAMAMDSRDGWTILWPFAAIVAALWILARIARRSSDPSADAEAKAEHSAARSWVVRGAADTKPAEMLDWMLEQAVHAGWRIPPVVALAGACQEIIGFLQRTLPHDSPITVRANLHPHKGVLTIAHEGRPLALPDYKAAPSLDALDDASLEGLELRVAAAQVEQMSYQARLSDLLCSFTLRQTY